MKHLKLFESFEDIDSICKEYRIENYTINPDGTVDVDGDINIYFARRGEMLTKIPLKFGRVSGNFDCMNNRLTTLEGSPSYVGGTFFCSYNKLTTLEGAPESVGGNFHCSDNQLITLEGGPKRVGGHFNCSDNQLTTLEGGPKRVGGDFNCNTNKLTTLEGSPSYVGGTFFCSNNKLTTLEGAPREVSGNFSCMYNPVHEIYRLFKNHKDFMYSLDFDYIRGNKIIKSFFKEACDEAGIDVPRYISGYEYI
jgi:hypothetical protein